MAITIKELLASDTLSDAVDKINFNFDQLLLNGGGPQGPNGPIGPIGPIGGRGIRGTQWFEDPASSPGTNPNSLTFADLEEGDNYLQADGTVWEYNGTVWVATSVNLTGPQGAAGTSGFSRFGSPINNQQSIYISPMPLAVQNGLGDPNNGGASAANEAVPTLVVGGFVSITPTVSGLTYQKSLISDSMAQSIESTNSAMFIHQLESTSTAIRFMGGNTVGDNYEQSNIADLASISLISDDRLLIQVPKAPINTSSINNLSGYIVNTIETGQYHQSGKHIHFITGQSSNSSGSAFENSDFNVTVNKSAGTSGNPRILLNVTSIGGGLPASINIGSNTAIPASTTNTGSVIVTGGLIGLTGSSTIGLTTSSNISQQATGNITLNSGSTIQLTAAIDLTINVTDDITITGGDNLTINITDLININAGDSINIGSSVDIEIDATDDLRLWAKRYETPNISSGGPAGITPSPTLSTRGSVHLNQASGAFGNTQVRASLDSEILLSGEFGFNGDGTTGPGGFGRFNGNWIRVGNVIFVTGYIFESPSGGVTALTCTGSTLTIPLPLTEQPVDSPPTITAGAYGHGTINTSGLAASGKSDQVTVGGGSSGYTNVTAVDSSIQFANDIDVSAGIRVSFSYRLDT